MPGRPQNSNLNIYSTAPQSADVDRTRYVARVAEVARWSERAGCRGILVYADNRLVDPWLVSNIILQHTEQLCPLVALQPVYMHPYAAAKMVTSFGHLYNRRLCLNLLAGGFRTDLLALNDETPHDDRYKRLTEYSLIMKRLLESPEPVTFAGDYYSVRGLRMNPPLPEALMPGLLISGSSAAGLAAAREIGATPIKYPQKSSEEPYHEHHDGNAPGIRVGIIARETAEEAWQVAHLRFPEDHKGKLAHQLAMKVSDSLWHKQLSGKPSASDRSSDEVYWLGPFQHYKTFCPYLVGSYEQVGQEVAAYVDRGYRTFILDIPPCEEELDHTSVVFQEALENSQICHA
jgi:alkanesulfonate monooxygenase